MHEDLLILLKKAQKSTALADRYAFIVHCSEKLHWRITALAFSFFPEASVKNRMYRAKLQLKE